jgi:hypothetical protein
MSGKNGELYKARVGFFGDETKEAEIETIKLVSYIKGRNKFLKCKPQKCKISFKKSITQSEIWFNKLPPCPNLPISTGATTFITHNQQGKILIHNFFKNRNFTKNITLEFIRTSPANSNAKGRSME